MLRIASEGPTQYNYKTTVVTTQCVAKVTTSRFVALLHFNKIVFFYKQSRKAVSRYIITALQLSVCYFVFVSWPLLAQGVFAEIAVSIFPLLSLLH